MTQKSMRSTLVDFCLNRDFSQLKTVWRMIQQFQYSQYLADDPYGCGFRLRRSHGQTIPRFFWPVVPTHLKILFQRGGVDRNAPHRQCNLPASTCILSSAKPYPPNPSQAAKSGTPLRLICPRKPLLIKLFE